MKFKFKDALKAGLVFTALTTLPGCNSVDKYQNTIPESQMNGPLTDNALVQIFRGKIKQHVMTTAAYDKTIYDYHTSEPDQKAYVVGSMSEDMCWNNDNHYVINDGSGKLYGKTYDEEFLKTLSSSELDYSLYDAQKLEKIYKEFGENYVTYDEYETGYEFFTALSREVAEGLRQEGINMSEEQVFYYIVKPFLNTYDRCVLPEEGKKNVKNDLLGGVGVFARIMDSLLTKHKDLIPDMKIWNSSSSLPTSVKQ
jgi:hypothetical protein